MKSTVADADIADADAGGRNFLKSNQLKMLLIS